MAILKQGGSDPYRGQVMTTMGYRESRPPLCIVCGGRRDGLYTINGNGQVVCPDCAGEKHRVVLTGCGTDPCSCEEAYGGEDNQPV